MKVSIVGAGNVGATAALRIIEKDLADVVLVDICEGIPQGKALDILESTPLIGTDKKIIGTNDFSEIKDSDIVVITAGFPRKPGMDREELIHKNKGIIDSVCEAIKEYSPKSIVIVVTNPLDIMSYAALKATGFEKKKVIGMAGMLDTTRFKTVIAEETGALVKDIETMTLGAHGDSMVPVLSETKIAGKVITEVMDVEKIEKLVNRTKKGGGEFLPLLNTSAWIAPGFSIAEMVGAIIEDSKKILPCSVLLEGEYGYNDIYLGVPVRLGREGAEEIVEIKLDDETKKELDNSAKITKDNIDMIR